MTDQDGGGARARRRIRPVAELDAARPPQSVEAEQAVLGGLLLDNSTWDAIATASPPTTSTAATTA